MLIKKAEPIPLEVICRNYAYGSFLRRYQGYVKSGKKLDGLIELTLKNDELDDPLIVDEAVEALGLVSLSELMEIRKKTSKVNEALKSFLSKKGYELIDFKVEFGRCNGNLIVIDDLSLDTMRIRDKKTKKIKNHFELEEELGI